MGNSLWYKNAVFYEVYVRGFKDSSDDGNGDLNGLIQKTDYLHELGIDCLWLLPIYPSPLIDDGYDISDYCSVLPDYGTLEDFKALLDTAHQKGMRVITDLVLNHTSDQHPWFQAARVNRNSPYRDYYVWSDTDQKYQDARIIFLDTEKSNWTWDETAGQYFWHRFYSSQPDLNYDNPAVQDEMLSVIGFWLELGIDGFRVDAVPYLYEREGTNCENLPETHAFLKRIRRFIDDNYSDRVLLCEANQWPQDVRSYFGDGDECHMGFHFPVMPRIFMALRKGDRAPLVDILEQTPDIPPESQWCTFLRNHDELTLEMVTEDEREWMWQEYAPESRMRQNLGIRRRLAPLLGNNKRKIELAYSLLFSLPGSPVIYYGDEIGMGDNIWLTDRNGLRTPMQWDAGPNAGFSRATAEKLYAPLVSSQEFGSHRVNVASQRTDPNSLWCHIRSMILLHKENPVFGLGEFRWQDANNDAVAAYWRTLSERSLLIINNLSPDSQNIRLRIPEWCASEPVDLFSGRKKGKFDGEYLVLRLQPFQFLWLNVEKDIS